jgi:predicted membrane protein (TIGR00267 family)
MISRIRNFIRLTNASRITRRYFVTNGFDGALTMLGLNMGFYYQGEIATDVALGACFATAVALMMSGFSSAYISESAERRKELSELEHAMVQDMEESDHGGAARLVPYLIALVNGLSPFLISLLIISPLWLSMSGIDLPLPPIEAALLLSFMMIFLLGLYSSRISGQFWLWTGIRALIVAMITSGIIWLVR